MGPGGHSPGVERGGTAWVGGEREMGGRDAGVGQHQARGPSHSTPRGDRRHDSCVSPVSERNHIGSPSVIWEERQKPRHRSFVLISAHTATPPLAACLPHHEFDMNLPPWPQAPPTAATDDDPPGDRGNAAEACVPPRCHMWGAYGGRCRLALVSRSLPLDIPALSPDQYSTGCLATHPS